MPSTPTPVVVLVSGTGTLLQALLEACENQDYGVEIVAVGADRDGTGGLERARVRGIPTFVVPLSGYPGRAAWDVALADAVGQHAPALVVSAGFMKILGPVVLERFTVINSHPALLPSFPGAHAVQAALAHGVKVTGCTLHHVDLGVDTGPIIAQRAVEVRDGETAAELHERIKVLERELLVEHLPRLAQAKGTDPLADAPQV